MKEVSIRNLSCPERREIRARYCDSFLCRLRGLTFKRHLAAGTGLLLVQPKESRLDASIHMFFMWIDLAVVWINSALQVVDVKTARRWKPVYLPQQPARYVLELPVENQSDFSVGDCLAFEILDVSSNHT